ncbi:TetR/AcrR family transcriptional regulator [Nonomuraea gerenzanensis]|uniref:Transcriptional regulator, TetR family n=1 Tax=Nonomuraea gerenzanensis TaxID=93944 RepID=A0A1M4E7V3_9ACTN|nr:TetR/AcrR family transcriptional regulator [Nonomuraea gerenzanensis]UBU17211.1 TetR family transcriptional regulator [Nonomuraea gerenzanensis]SBO94951.1 Transcriptional regulator, TetR family [Nonomuraea gerenzanensis]
MSDAATSPTPAAGRRRRDAAATRQAILDAAVAAFTRHGYDGVGVRDIAQGAGVTAMLINRYFGSKERLFAEAVDVAFAPRTVIAGTGAALPGETARELVRRTSPEAEELGPFLLMLRSAANPQAARIMREAIGRHAGRHLNEELSGSGAGVRAELMLSLQAGVWLMRGVLGTTALTEAAPGELAERLEPLFRLLVTPGADAPPRP